MKSVQQLKAVLQSNVMGDSRRRRYTESFKKEVIAAHYNYNNSILSLAHELGISSTALQAWKLSYGHEVTGIKHRTRVLFDVRSKCLIVKKYLEGGHTSKHLSNEYKISVSSITGWVLLYKDTYKQYIDNLPDGVPYIVKEEKLIYGDKNVIEAKARIDENIELLKKLSVNLEMGRVEKKTISDLMKKEEGKKRELDNAMAILAKHGVSI